jgi:hypothetical protein
MKTFSFFFSILLFAINSFAFDYTKLVNLIALELTTSTCPRLALYQECEDFCPSDELRSLEDQAIGIAISENEEVNPAAPIKINGINYDPIWRDQQITNIRQRIDALAVNFTGNKEYKKQLLNGYLMYVMSRAKSSKTFISLEESFGIFRL